MTDAGQDAVIYTPPNKLRDKVTQGGRIPGDGFDKNVLARANASVKAMAGNLLQAVEQDMAGLAETCGRLEGDASRREEHFIELEKLAHGITAYGTTIGFDLLTRFGRSLSLFLGKTDIGEPVKLKVAQAHVDSMVLVYRTPIRGKGGKDGDTLTAMLNLTVSKFIAEP